VYTIVIDIGTYTYITSNQVKSNLVAGMGQNSCLSNYCLAHINATLGSIPDKKMLYRGLHIMYCTLY